MCDKAQSKTGAEVAMPRLRTDSEDPDQPEPALPTLDLPPESPYSERAMRIEEAFADMLDAGEMDEYL